MDVFEPFSAVPLVAGIFQRDLQLTVSSLSVPLNMYDTEPELPREDGD